MIRKFALISAALLLAGCDGPAGTTTTTKLDAVEVEPGTASDAMIQLDDSDIDGTSVDDSGGGSLTAEGAAAVKAEAGKIKAVAPEPQSETTAAGDSETATKPE